jgi:sortase A
MPCQPEVTTSGQFLSRRSKRLCPFTRASVLPGQVDNSVLAGHRDSVFSQLGKLKLGDLIMVDTSAGNFTYKVSRFRIVGENDRTVIVPTKTAVLTLSTCYPFFYIGNAPKRFIVSANLLEAPKGV